MVLFRNFIYRTSLDYFRNKFKLNHFETRGIQKDIRRSIVPLETWKKDKESFQRTLPDFVNDFVSEKTVADVPIAAKRLKDVLEYILAGGKRNRSLFIISAHKLMAKPEDLTPENLKICWLLGWTMEIIQSCGSVADDIFDDSETRRGLTCWHRLPGVGMHAINDSVLVLFITRLVIERHIGDKPYFRDVIRAFDQFNAQAMIGQHLDFEAQMEKGNYDRYTPDFYKLTCKYKAGLYTFGLPITWILYMNNIYEYQTHCQVQEIAGELGYMYQLQNDYLDCYGEAETGKVGSDIQNGGATWLAIKTLELSNPSQKAIFKACYGSKDPEHTNKIKKLYDELELPTLLREEERMMYDKILSMSQKMPTELFPLYATVLDRIYGRKL